MPNKKRIIILSVSIGTGHTRASEAIKMAMQDKYPGSDVLIIDTFENANPLLGKLIFGSYLTMIKKFPLLYRQIYTSADGANKLNVFNRDKVNLIIRKLTQNKLIEMISQFNPDVIICTHFFPLGIMAGLKQEKKINKPLLAVITDFIIHPYWIYKNVDTYFVAVQEQKDGLVLKGVPEKIITVTGIPIHPNFSKELEKEVIKKKLDLKEGLPTVMLMGGGLGMGPVGKIVKYLIRNQIPAQFLVVVGRNEKLRRRLENIVSKTTLNVKIFGFVENVHELMHITDLVITKPGGLTVAEALSKGLPMVLTKPIPGHEEENAEFLIRSGAALEAKSEDVLIDILKNCIQNPGKMTEMSKKAASIGNRSSAYDITSILAGY